MKQIVHIFTKDIRHLWPEILISLLFMIGFAYVYPSELRNEVLDPTLLVPVGWFLLIVRVVQEESLVGDRQFWITRPMSWGTLLAAKCLFIFFFVYLPLLAVQWILLMRAGLRPEQHLGGLFYNLLLLSGVCVLPITAIATITADITRAISISVACIAVGFVGLPALEALHRHINGGAPLRLYAGDPLALPILVGLCSLTIVLQYATRRTKIARTILLVIPLLLWAGGALFASDALIDSVFTPSLKTSAMPITLTMQEGGLPLRVNGASRDNSDVEIEIPLHTSSVSDEDVWIPNGVRVRIDTAQGTLWTSSWESIYVKYLGAGAHDVVVNVAIDRHVFDSVQNMPITMHLYFAITQAQRAAESQILLPRDSFDVPGFGQCHQRPLSDGLICRSAFSEPPLTRVRASVGPCVASGSGPSSQGRVADAWVGTLRAAPAEFGISPYVEEVVTFPAQAAELGMVNAEPVCPGTPVSFTRYAVLRQVQTELAVANLQLRSGASPDASSPTHN